MAQFEWKVTFAGKRLTADSQDWYIYSEKLYILYFYNHNEMTITITMK